jgi:hypothetical protein
MKRAGQTGLSARRKKRALGQFRQSRTRVSIDL